ncbi:MAG: bifunctional diaminohydroxyphosphoribosylaminopyrimidine deaminase/5-amino-6-(5-phosphoribosylamino)uracil reductase RibD [Kangiellaceae bacterium]|jgi:diaminohydroxyphosphoribosylaminopyrimidine deaminase / 5-amino-6-(5-phosphoribosylamino)uracil reductase
MNDWSAQDHQFMAEALRLAKRGEFTARPNPVVGCVIVKNGDVIGRGWHQSFGQAHAEINALQQAGEQAKGATCYVTLEPCAHVGKTGSCAQALKQSGVAKVIAAMQDPNPEVSGKGLRILEQAGIATQSGLLELQARKLNPGFLSHFERHRPFVTVKLAMSLDGRTALKNGQSQWITGAQARADVQRLRAKQDVIITGIGTQQSDDPSLTARLDFSSVDQTVELHFRQPLRVLFDRHGKANLNDKIFKFNQPSSERNNSQQNADIWKGKQVWWMTLSDQRSALADSKYQHIEAHSMTAISEVLSALSERGASQVLVEAGHRLAGSFLKLGLVDQLVIYMAPKLMGNHAMGLFDLQIEQMDQCLPLDLTDVRQFGDDIRLTYKLSNDLSD